MLKGSPSIDNLVDEMEGFVVLPEQAQPLEALVYRMNVGFTKLCHTFHSQRVSLSTSCQRTTICFIWPNLGGICPPSWPGVTRAKTLCTK